MLNFRTSVSYIMLHHASCAIWIIYHSGKKNKAWLVYLNRYFHVFGWGGVIGGPGTGKGTQCTRLKDEFGFKHISLGDILRNEVKQGSNIGKQCENLMKDGKLVPLPLTMQLMKKAIQTSGHHSGYLIDGFPRAVEQAKAFQQQVIILTFIIF